MSERLPRVPGPLVENWDWQLHGACRNEDIALFFPEPDEYRPHRVARAKQVCRQCPVLTQCRDYALKAGETNGIWGGMTASERRAVTKSAS